MADAEVQLLELEGDPERGESVNAIFRSFHTIKGLAGFMELDPIQNLAHQSETFLDLCRSKRMSSQAVDLIFNAIDAMKHLTQLVRSAVEQGQASIEIDIPLAALLQRLEQAVSNEAMFLQLEPIATTDGSNKALNPPPRLGEILVRDGIADADTIESALQDQKNQQIGVKLGEVLVREHDLPAKKVSAALREQRASTQASVVVRESVKVDAMRLDRLVDAIGELVIAESMVSEDKDVARIAVSGSELLKRINLLRKITRELQEIATSLRMIPIKGTFQRMARLVRDVASRTGKKVEFFTQGEDTELDKNVVDRIGDPLVHMVRNAVDHGLESDQETRKAAGKSAAGKVQLRPITRVEIFA